MSGDVRNDGVIAEGSAADVADSEADRLRDAMVDRMTVDGWLPTGRVEAAFRSVYRHAYLPGEPLDKVYSGASIPVYFKVARDADAAPGGVAALADTLEKMDSEPAETVASGSSEPAVMAQMLEQLQVEPGHRVLEIGTGTGYNTAVLNRLVGADGSVLSMEIRSEIAEATAARLRQNGAERVVVLPGDGWAGSAEHGPFDRIIATACGWDVSPHWVDQLVPGGIVVVPLWLRAGIQVSVAFRKNERGTLTSESIIECGFFGLLGSHGGPPVYVPVDDWGGWIASVDDGAAEGVLDTVRSVLHDGPRTAAPGELPTGWFTRLALTDERAIRLFRLDGAESRLWLGGLVGRDGVGMAAVELEARTPADGGGDHRPISVQSFGSGAAEEQLMSFLAECRPLELSRLRITARQDSTDADEQSGWVLPRPVHRFVITEQDPPAVGEEV